MQPAGFAILFWRQKLSIADLYRETVLSIRSQALDTLEAIVKDPAEIANFIKDPGAVGSLKVALASGDHGKSLVAQVLAAPGAFLELARNGHEEAVIRLVEALSSEQRAAIEAQASKDGTAAMLKLVAALSPEQQADILTAPGPVSRLGHGEAVIRLVEALSSEQRAAIEAQASKDGTAAMLKLVAALSPEQQARILTGSDSGAARPAVPTARPRP